MQQRFDPSGHIALATGASKAGVIPLTKTRAMALLRSGIRVDAFCPNYFETKMNADFFAADKGWDFIACLPPKRL